MQVVSFFNHKGGVGKTTLLFNVGIAMAVAGERVLFVDADAQANLTGTALSAEKYQARLSANETIYDSLVPVIEATGQPVAFAPVQIRETAWLIPGHIKLSEYEEALAKSWSDTTSGQLAGFQRSTALFRVIKETAAMVGATIVLVDLGPSVGALNRVALLSSDGFVVPLSPDLFSLTALPSVGSSLANWIADWRIALQQAPRFGADVRFAANMPKGTPSPLGYISQQFASYRSAPAAAFQRWIDEMPGEYQTSIVDRLSANGIAVPSEPGQIGIVRNLSSLVPMAQEANAAIFELSGSEARGAQYIRAKDTISDFTALAIGIQERLAEVA